MSTYELALVIGSLLAATLGFIWVAIRLGGSGPKSHKDPKDKDYTKTADKEIEHIFNDEFREELRNRGRLHFEKIIGENAMFLQQDLRLTTSELNDYMKQEISRTLQEEFSKYEESIHDAKQLAIDSISKTQDAIEQQRKLLEESMQKEVTNEKSRVIERFEKNMGDIINHYIVAAIGDQIDLSDQLEYIVADLNANKAEIIEDVQRGA